MASRVSALLACLVLAFVSCARSTAQPAATPLPRAVGPGAGPPPGETTPPLPVANGVALSVQGAPQRALFDRAVRATEPRNTRVAQRVILSYGAAFVIDGDRVRAIDLATGATRWTSASGFGPVFPGMIADEHVVLAERSDFSAVSALRHADGGVAYTLPRTVPAGFLNGVLYANQLRERTLFASFVASNGTAIWQTPGGGASPDGSPRLIGTTLLQGFYDSGAILVRSLYAFDVRNGHALWSRRANRDILGFNGATIYIDSTWFPMQLDNYVPLTIAHLDVASGAVRSEYTYQPDPSRNAHPPNENPGRADAAAVSAGFVYLRVRGAWYRYDADVVPPDAHPARLDGVDDILAWFDSGALLVSAGGHLAVARDHAGRLELHAFASADRHSEARTRSDGTRYVAGGGTLYAIAPDAVTARALGAAPCPIVPEMQIAQEIVAAICPSEADLRITAFRDPVRAAPSAPPVARPQRPTPPPFTVQMALYPIPPRPEPMRTQWWLGPMAPLPDGGVAFLLDPGSGEQHAIGRAARDGSMTFTPLAGDPPPAPADIVTDRHGTIWFNDRNAATISTLDAQGRVAARLVGEPSPTPQPQASGGPPRVRRLSLAIRLAVGPDGEAWFARSRPSPLIGRADGSVKIPIPDAIGEIVRLRGDRDGFWFTSRAGIGHVTAAGAFSNVFSPLPGVTQYSDYDLVAPAADGSLWFVRRYQTGIVHVTRNGVVRTMPLPNATVQAQAITVGCDGALYVAESVSQIARITPDGHVDEFPLDVFGIDGIARGAGCRLWFVAGSNSLHQQLGSLELTPR